MIYRFDDICINTDMPSAIAMAEHVKATQQFSEVWFCISPNVHKMETGDYIKDQRIFPSILNAHSDFTNFYKVEHCGIPEFPDWITRASHGLIHVDHRLLEFATQELSIVSSCSLSNSKIFVPPFNKWNEITEAVCKKHHIHLVKFEDNWLSMEHNNFNPMQRCWYLHNRAFTVDTFKKWFQNV